MNIILNNLGSERSVEIPFTTLSLEKYYKPGGIVLDVGGIPTNNQINAPIFDIVKKLGIDYRISDFRGGHYPGDFVTYNFQDKLFDIIMFISSLEHFPQCTEGDLIYRPNEDRKGYLKALSILKPNGKIILTVPFGKCIWQKYHQNYNKSAILNLTEGSKIIEAWTYRLTENNTWELTDPLMMEEILYTDKAHGVGCFVMEKV